ncbi:hypothetical protein ACROYT_G033687 [Oculina patagonica]
MHMAQRYIAKMADLCFQFDLMQTSLLAVVVLRSVDFKYFTSEQPAFIFDEDCTTMDYFSLAIVNRGKWLGSPANIKRANKEAKIDVGRLQGTEALKMAALISERVGIKDISRTATVPGNPKAILMYYLDCVAVVIDLNSPNLNRLRNYRNYYSLNDAETDALLALVLLFSPDKLIGKVFIPSEDCGGGANQFFELSAVSNMLAVADNIVIGGERKRVDKIMFFKRSWMENNYITPIM